MESRSTDTAVNDDISRTDLLPFITSFGDLRRRAFLWPGVTGAVFCAVLLLLAALNSETGFFWCLAGFISLANIFLVYLWCGKKMPFPFVLGVAVFAFFLDMVLAPAIVAAEKALPSLIAPGLIEEPVKAMPVVLVFGLGTLLSHARQRKYGVREPLDGILLAAASATGFAFFETMFIYVPKYGALISAPRLLVILFGHIAYAGSFGYFIGLATMRHRRAIPAAVAILIGFALANVLHDLWDTVGYYGKVLSIISPLQEAVLAILSYVVLASLILHARELSPEREFLWPFGSIMPYRAPEVGALPAMPALRGDIWLAIGSSRISLTETSHLTVRDIPSLKPPGPDGIVAEVREHPTDPTLLVLRNLSKDTWQAVFPDGTVRAVAPAGTVRLLAGTRLVFGSLAGAIVVTPHDTSDDPRARPADEWC